MRLSISDKPIPKGRKLTTPLDPTPLDRVEGVHKHTEKYLSSDAKEVLSYAMEGTVWPSEVRKRVKERHSMDGFSLEKSVTIDFEVPSNISQKREIIFPLLRPEKGRLLDGMRIYGRTGSQLRTLNVEESLGVSAAMVQTTLAKILGLRNIEFKDWPVEVGRFYLKCLERLIEVPQVKSEALTTHRQRIGEEVKRGLSELPTFPDAEPGQVTLFIGLMETLVTNYCIFAIIPDQETGLVVYQQSTRLSPTKSKSEHHKTRRLRRLVDSARVWFHQLLGTLPSVVELPVNKAQRCESYHVEFSVPRALYIDSVHLCDINLNRVLLQRNSHNHNLGGPHFRVSQVGTNKAHFYSRGMAAIEEPLILRIAMLERPGESLLRAFILSALVLGTSLWFSAVRTQFVHKPLESLGTLSFVVGAIPAVFGAFLAVVGRKLRGRLVAKLSYASAALSGISLLFVVQLALHGRALSDLARNWVHLHQLTKWLRTPPAHSWELLVAICSLHAVLLLVTIIIRASRVYSLTGSSRLSFESGDH